MADVLCGSMPLDTLSFGDQAPQIMNAMRDMGKIAVLMGSICAGILGSLLVNMVGKFENRKK